MKKTAEKKALSGNERGAMLAEFALMLPFYVISLFFMIFIYELAGDMQKKSEEVRYDLRRQIAVSGHEGFHPTYAKTIARATPVPGLRTFIGGTKSVDIVLYGYRGYRTGIGQSQYRTGDILIKRRPEFRWQQPFYWESIWYMAKRRL